mmetsp:Transcript_104685/g.240005  ORF Transcript_104685/g.240005 Transcript_104685/m.240005 type:complete len:510 (+) Transcript_104685:74-1603(+)
MQQQLAQLDATTEEEAQQAVAMLTRMMQENQDQSDASDALDPNPCDDPMVLDSLDLPGLVKFLKETKPTNVICMVGQGLSELAGVPDPRSKDVNASVPGHATVLDNGLFRQSPEHLYEYCKEIWPTGEKYKPTVAHHFLTLLHEKGMLRRVYTENIDSLEAVAGVPEEKVVAVHGNLSRAQTLSGVDVPPSLLYEAICKGPEAWKDLQEQRGGLVRPGIMFDGEGITGRFRDLRNDDCRACDLLIVMGTKLTSPFNVVVGRVPRLCPRVLISAEPVGLFPPTVRDQNSGGLFLKGGFTFAAPKAYRDVLLHEEAPQGVMTLVEAAGWGPHLRRIAEAKLPQVEPSAWAPPMGYWQDVTGVEALENLLDLRLLVCPEAFEAALTLDLPETLMGLDAQAAARIRAIMYGARDSLRDLLSKNAYPGGMGEYVNTLRRAQERDAGLLDSVRSGVGPAAQRREMVAALEARLKAIEVALASAAHYFESRGQMLPGEDPSTPRSMPDLVPIPIPG